MVELEGTMKARGSVAAEQAAAHSLAVWRWPLVAIAVIFGLFLWLYGDFMRSQWIHARFETSDWGHTLVIPLISGYFVYLNWRHITASQFRTTWLGLIPVVAGVGIYALSNVGPQPLRHYNIQGFGVWTTLVGLFILFCGWRAMRWLWFPLVFLLIFGQTISPALINKVTFQMQDLTARGAYYLLCLGADVDRDGNTLYVFHDGKSKPLNIAEACSGMRMLMALLALGVFFAYTGLSRFWQRAVLVAMAVPTAIIVNILRVVTLGILSLYDTGFAAGDFHSLVGLVWLVPAIFIFMGLMWAIRNAVIDVGSEATKASA
jgi:exosortase